jgi:hypothetical protein
VGDVPWERAGGPDECAHGYAAGVPCSRCAAPTPRERAEALGWKRVAGRQPPCWVARRLAVAWRTSMGWATAWSEHGTEAKALAHALLLRDVVLS